MQVDGQDGGIGWRRLVAAARWCNQPASNQIIQCRAARRFDRPELCHGNTIDGNDDAIPRSCTAHDRGNLVPEFTHTNVVRLIHRFSVAQP